MKKIAEMTKQELNAYKYSKLRESIARSQVIINGVDEELLEVLRKYIANKENK